MSNPPAHHTVIFHYSSFTCGLRLPPNAAELKLQDPAVLEGLTVSFKKLLRDISGCTLQPGEKPAFSIPVLSPEENKSVTLGEILKKEYQLFVRCLTETGKEFCPLVRDLKFYREKSAELNAELLILQEGT